jgi:hypothetical protein
VTEGGKPDIPLPFLEKINISNIIPKIKNYVLKKFIALS